MRRLGFVVALVATACFKPTPPEGAACNANGECPEPLSCYGGICARAPNDSSAGQDADGGPSCASHPMLGAFGAPVLNTVVSSSSDEGTPSLTADRLELYFKSTRPGGKGAFDIWRTTRGSTGDPWETPATVSEINTTANDLGVEISGDGLTIYFSSDRFGSASFDFYVASRASRTSAFGAATRILELSSNGVDEGIYVSPDQTIAYFQSDRLDTAANATLFRATRASPTAAWSPPVRVTELSTTAGEENAWVTADDCVIYFQSARVGTTGSIDLWTARRPAAGKPFAGVTNLGALNGGAADADPQLSADERTIYFASNRPGLGIFDIYEATR